MQRKLHQYDAILAAVQSVPAGRVATYGQVAEAAGLPGRARLVGKVLGRLPEDSGVPWHRIVNAQGRISPRRGDGTEREQRLLLEDEGVEFDALGRVPLGRFGWPD